MRKRERIFMLNRTAIHSRMESQGLRQTDLAKSVEATDMQISLWVNGHRPPELDIVARMADVLNCKIDDIVTRRAA